MMVVMCEGATEEQVAHVTARVEEIGATAHVSAGERVTVIGVIGDREEITALPLEAMPGVDRVVAILKPYKLVGREFQQRDTVVDVRGVKIGGGHFAIIAGPCSVETPEQILATARAVKAAGGHMLRGGAFKPRTSPYAFQGLGEEGLEMLAEARDETGLPIVTEVMDPRDVDLVCALRRRAPDRRAQHAELPAAGGARQGRQAGAAQARARRPPSRSCCWRPSTSSRRATATSSSASAASAPSRRPPATRSTSAPCRSIKLASHLPVIVDPSHAAGRLDLVLPLSLAGVAAGADGVIVETHPNPEHALCDGPQSLPTAAFGEYAGRVLDLARWAGKTVD